MKKINVSVDHFGKAGDAAIQELLNQSSNRRARKVAFNNLVRFAKASGTLYKSEIVLQLGIVVNSAGEQGILFLLHEKQEPSS